MKKHNKLRPCDCHDRHTAAKLNEQGIAFNENSLAVLPAYVELKVGHTTIKIGMATFKRFAEWYLQEQEVQSNQFNQAYFDAAATT